MNVFIDNYYISRSRGMGRFVKCVKELSEKTQFLQSYSAIPYPLWEQLFVYWRLLFIRNSVVIFPYNTAPLFAFLFVKPVLVVHDLMYLDEKIFNLQYLLRPKSFLSFFYRRFFFYFSYKSSKSIIFVSEAVQKKFLNRFNYKGSTYVLNNTIVPSLEKSLLSINLKNQRKLGAVTKFVCVSGLSPTKNFNFLLNALIEFNKLDKGYDWELTVIGLPPILPDKLFARVPSKVRRKISILTEIDEAALAIVYADSDFILFPSISEGFGVPLIEAMASNLRLVVSNTSVMPTICGAEARYFDPYSVRNFVDVLIDAVQADSIEVAETRSRYLKKFCNKIFKEKLDQIIDRIEAN